MSTRMLYVGHAITKVQKGGRIRIPDLFASPLSKNGRELRFMVGKSPNDSCLICYDMGLRYMDLEECRAHFYPGALADRENLVGADRYMLGTMAVVDLSLSYSFRLPKLFADLVEDGEQILFLSRGNAIEIWNVRDFLNSKSIRKDLIAMIASQTTLVH